MPYIVTLVPSPPYAPWVEAIGYTPGTFSKPFKWKGEWIASVLASGTRIASDMVPRRYRVDVAADDLPDVFAHPFGYGVSDLFREKVEELEPAVHQFFSIEIVAMGGERPKKSYWLLNVCNRVDAILPEKTKLPLGPGGHQYSASGYKVGEPIEMVLRKDEILGKCMWIDRRFIDQFFSDELFEFVQENKLARFYSTMVEAE